MVTNNPKEQILNVLNQCLVSLQEADDYEIMKPEIFNAIQLLGKLEEKPKQEIEALKIEQKKLIDKANKEKRFFPDRVYSITAELDKLGKKEQEE
tara:strand:+ start:80 stop:364 length:285 start_codon:yes stop_codon:yes gene_type:complete